MSLNYSLVDIISYVISCFISYNQTLMKKLLLSIIFWFFVLVGFTNAINFTFTDNNWNYTPSTFTVNEEITLSNVEWICNYEFCELDIKQWFDVWHGDNLRWFIIYDNWNFFSDLWNWSTVVLQPWTYDVVSAWSNFTSVTFWNGVSSPVRKLDQNVVWFVNSISSRIVSIFNPIRDFVVNIVSFIWDIISFILYAFRSIIFLTYNLIYSILNWFVALFTQLTSTFSDLSVFMWSTTAILIYMFLLVILYIVFQFVLRLLLWKFHYKKVWWK